MSKREHEIIRSIIEQEEIRSALISKDKTLISKWLNSNPQTSIMFRLQLFMNHLRDLCVDCSKCCEVSDIDVNPYDLERLAFFLKMPQNDFVSKYCVPHPNEPSFFFRLKDMPCIFLKDKKCTVYTARPNSCVFFPFLTMIQKEGIEMYIKSNKKTLTLPIWCKSAVKIKQVNEKQQEILNRLSPEEKEKLSKYLEETTASSQQHPPHRIKP